MTKPKPKEKPKRGRPTIKIDQGQLESLCRMNPTLADTAAFFKCSPDTIERVCKSFGYKDFADARQQNMVHTRLKLIRNALAMADKGNTAMIIFCLKNLCGWADKVETAVDGEKNVIQLKYSLEEKKK